MESKEMHFQRTHPTSNSFVGMGGSPLRKCPPLCMDHRVVAGQWDPPHCLTQTSGTDICSCWVPPTHLPPTVGTPPTPCTVPAFTQGGKGAARRTLVGRDSRGLLSPSTMAQSPTHYLRGPGARDDFWTDATQPLYLSQARILLPSADDYCKAQSPLAPAQHRPVIPVG